jgi:LPS-assembly lipoprotein
MKRTLAALGFILLLSSCGFHLRGQLDSVPTWLNPISVIADGNTPLSSTLQALLESYKINVTNEPSQANYWIMLKPEQLGRQIISVGASTNPRQYQLMLSIVFSLQDKKGRILKPESVITVRRQLTINNDRILGSNDEEVQLITEMRQDACMQLINRLAATKTYETH